ATKPSGSDRSAAAGYCNLVVQSSAQCCAARTSSVRSPPTPESRRPSISPSSITAGAPDMTDQPMNLIAADGKETRFPLVLGLDTFGDRTNTANGEPLSHAQTIRNVVEEGVLAEDVGVDFFGIGEHHTDYFPMP